MARRRSRVALLVLAVMIVGGVVGYRVATAPHGAMEVVARDRRPAPVPMHASLFEAAVPTAESAPSAAVDLTREQRLREFQDALTNAWREGLAQAATAPADTPTGSAGPPIPTASADLATVTDTQATPAVADLPIASASASAAAIAAPMLTTTDAATEAPPVITAALTTIVTAAPPAALTITAVDAGPQDLRVVVYSASWCPACQQAKAWMTAYGIPFEERDVDATTEYVQELRLLNRRMTIPTFYIDGNVMVGFSPRRLVLMLQRAMVRRLQGGAL